MSSIWNRSVGVCRASSRTGLCPPRGQSDHRHCSSSTWMSLCPCFSRNRMTDSESQTSSCNEWSLGISAIINASTRRLSHRRSGVRRDSRLANHFLQSGPSKPACCFSSSVRSILCLTSGTKVGGSQTIVVVSRLMHGKANNSWLKSSVERVTSSRLYPSRYSTPRQYVLSAVHRAEGSGER